MAEISLKCSCGTVQGTASNITVKSGLRMVCYCKSCQAFAKYLNQEDKVLDEFGGTEIFLMPPSDVKFHQGSDQLRCMRVTSKGPYRWYTECCKTPVGNTIKSSIPFLTVIHNIMEHEAKPEKSLGSIKAHLNGKYARGNLPPEKNQTRPPLKTILGLISRLSMWKIKGMNKPSPFFNASGEPTSAPSRPAA